MIHGLARSRERGAAKRAEAVMRDSVRRVPPKQPPPPQGMTTERFNIVLTAWVRSFCVVLFLGAPFSANTLFLLSVCLSNLPQQAKSGFDYGPERAEQLIVTMDEVDGENGGHGLLKPNIQSFTSVMDAYAQTNE